MNSPLRVVIATTAFALGIDCPDVCHIINYGLPSDVESYVQETGRAGRDSLPSGRAGRDSLPSLATLVKKTAGGRFLENPMID